MNDAQKRIIDEVDIWYRAIIRKDTALQPYEARLFKAYAEWKHALKNPIVPRDPKPPIVPPPPPPRPSRSPTVPEIPSFLERSPLKPPSRHSLADGGQGTQRPLERYPDPEETPTQPTPPKLQEALIWRSRFPSAPSPRKGTKPF